MESILSFIFISILYFFQNKNYEYLLKQKEYLTGLVDQISLNVTEEGKTSFPFIFIDWPTHYIDGDPDEDKRLDEITGTHALTVYAIKCAKELFEILGEKTDKCDEILSRLLKTEYKVNKYKQISGIKLVAGVGNKSDADLIVKGGAKGMSTFMSYFILKGAVDYGYETESIEMMKAYYGAMLNLGATSFWEDFDVAWAENAGRIAYGIGNGIPLPV